MEEEIDKDNNPTGKKEINIKVDKEEIEIKTDKEEIKTEIEKEKITIEEKESENENGKEEISAEKIELTKLVKLTEKVVEEIEDENSNKEKIEEIQKEKIEEVEKKIEKLKEEEIKNIKLIPKQELTIGVIHNITPNVNEAHLKEIFSNYGEVKEVYIPINDETQKKKNYAFIEFVKKENAENARLYMDGGQIDGKVVSFEILAKKNCVEM